MKKKGKTAPSAHETATPPPPRRNFLVLLWGILGGAALFELVWLVGAFLSSRTPAAAMGTFGAVITAGPVGGFEKGSVTAFPRGQFYLARLEDGGFLALSRRCTHLGCTVPWSPEENRFVCPCHASVFDIRGEVVRSPAPRALDLFEVTIENGVVSVDTLKKITRNRYEPSQVVFPSEAIR